MDIGRLHECPSNTLLRSRSGWEDSAEDRAETTVRLLVIDDEIRQDNPLVRLLELERIQVTTAPSGNAGLDYARAGGFDVILLDLKLPDILGMTVLSSIRTESIPIPVIVITGHFLETDHKDRALEIGAAGFVTKPIFDVAELGRMIHQVGSGYAVPVVPPPNLIRTLSPSGYVGKAPGYAKRGASSAQCREIPGLAALHARAVEGDRQAIEETIRLLLPAMRAWLRPRFPNGSSEWINAGVEDALLEYVADPCRYDRERGCSLAGFLYCNARRNVLNSLDSIRRRLGHETTGVAPEFWQKLPASAADEPSTSLKRLRDMLVTVRSLLTSEEQIIHDLQMANEHDSAVYVRALHLEHLPRSEQTRQVRLCTNAVSHRVRRALLRLRDGSVKSSGGN